MAAVVPVALPHTPRGQCGGGGRQSLHMRRDRQHLAAVLHRLHQPHSHVLPIAISTSVSPESK